MSDNSKNEVDFSPAEYFERVKSMKKTMTKKELDAIYENALLMANKFKITGQVRGMKKLLFCLDTIDKEKTLLDEGINIYIYKDDIDFYIDNVAENNTHIKLIELERYPREIPDEVAYDLVKVKDLFDQIYVLYTDYTETEDKKVEEHMKVKDPILFGTFQNKDAFVCIERFYYLGDWVDEYCDLTLEKMITQLDAEHYSAIRTIEMPLTKDELRDYFNNHYETVNSFLGVYKKTPDDESIHTSSKGMFHKIKTFLSRKRE